MIYFLTFLLIAVALAAMLLYLEKVKFNVDARALASSTHGYPIRYFSRDMLAGLPQPVQNYLVQVIPRGFPMSEFVHLKHKGRFRTGPDKKWMAISGEQFYTLSVPGFIWRGKTALFTADDRYFANEGSHNVKLFSIIPVSMNKGVWMDEGELLRWIAEHFWFPTNLLNLNLFRWENINERSSRLILRYRNHKIPVTVYFDESGLLDHITCMRYMDRKNLAKWTRTVYNYQQIHGLYIPTRVKASWHLRDGLFTYADFELTEINYSPSPEKYYQRQPEVSMAQ